MYTLSKNAYLELTFTGTKAWVMGTQDPGHGDMDVELDGKIIKRVSTQSSDRGMDRVLFSTELGPGRHTLKVICVTKALGINGFYYLDNQGHGIVELEQRKYSVDKGQTLSVDVTRAGGTKGELKFKFETIDDTAKNGIHYFGISNEYTIGDGQNHVLIEIKTKNFQSDKEKDDVFFDCKISPIGQENNVGFSNKSRVTIVDAFSYPKGMKYMDFNSAKYPTGAWKDGAAGKWSSEKGATMVFEFTGSKAYIVGTYDAKHGLMNVYVDGDILTAIVDTKSEIRKIKSILFITDDLKHDKHKIKIEVAGDGNVGVHGLIYLDNNEKGLFEVPESSYSVDKLDTVDVVVKRVGGASGVAHVRVITSDGSASSGKEYEPYDQKIEFGDGIKEKTISIKTLDYQFDELKNLTFSVQIKDAEDGALIGFNDSTIVNIIDHKTGIVDIHYREADQQGKWTETAVGLESDTIGSSLTFTFTGSLFWIIGTMNQGHGSLNVYIDDGEAILISSSGAMKNYAFLYQSETLEPHKLKAVDDTHTVKIEKAKEDGKVEISGIKVLNNQRQGLIDMAFPEYISNPGTTFKVKLSRIGGTSGSISTRFTTKDGTAVGGVHYDKVDAIVEFKDGEHSNEVKITLKPVQITSNLMFTCNIENPKSADIIGLNKYSTVTITSRAIPTASDIPTQSQTPIRIESQPQTIPILPLTHSSPIPVEPELQTPPKSIEPVEPTHTKPEEPVEQTQSKPIEPVEQTRSKPYEPIQPAQSNPEDPNKPTKPKTDEPVEPTHTKPDEPINPAKSKSNVYTTNPVGPIPPKTDEPVGPIPPKTNVPEESKPNENENQIQASDKASSNNGGMIAGVVIGLLVVIVITAILVMLYIRGRGNKEEKSNDDVLTDSEMETADYFSTNDAFENEDDPLWGSTQESPMYGEPNANIDDTPNDLDFEEEAYFTALT